MDGHLQDPENAASYFVTALQLLSPGQDGFLLYLTSPGAVYVQLYNALGRQGEAGDGDRLLSDSDGTFNGAQP